MDVGIYGIVGARHYPALSVARARRTSLYQHNFIALFDRCPPHGGWGPGRAFTVEPVVISLRSTTLPGRT